MVKEEATQRILEALDFDEEGLNNIMQKWRFCFIPDTVWGYLKLPDIKNREK